MANNSMTFSVVLEAVTAAFNKAMNVARQTYSTTTNSIIDDSANMTARSQAAGKAIFDSLNIRTGGAIRTEIAQLTQQLAAFKSQSGAPAAEIQRVTSAASARIAELKGELLGVNAASGNALGGLTKIGGSLAALAGVTLGLAGIKAGIEAVIEATIKFEQVHKQLEFATGSAEKAAKEFDFVRQVVTDLGLELNTTASGYAKLAAATKGTALEGEPTRKVFLGVASAVAALGLSADEANGVMLALSQIASKGKVSMEELRGQMGERLPGAMAIAAKSMGVTVSELDKLVESGLDSVTFLKAFGPAMVAAFGPSAANNVKTLQGSINLLKNQFTELLVKLGKGGVGDAAITVFSDIASAIGAIQVAMNQLDPATVKAVTETFRQLYGVVVSTFGALLTLIGDAFKALSSLGDLVTGTFQAFVGVDEAGTKVNLLTRSLQGVTIIIGLIRDGVEAISIAFTLVTGVVQKFFAVIAEGLAAVTFGDLSASLKKLSLELTDQSVASFAKAEAAAQKFESAAVSALDHAAGASEAAGARIGAAATVAGSTAAGAFGVVGESAQAAFRKAELAAASAGFTVSTAGGQIVEVITNQGKLGLEVADAFKAIGVSAGANIPPTIKSVQDMGAVIGAVAAQSQKLADDVAKSIPEALSKLNGPEIQQFQVAFLAGLDKAGASAATVSKLIGEIAQVAAKSLGVDLAGVLTKTSEAFDNNRAVLDGFIRDFDRLKASGVNSSLLIEQSLRSMLDKAKNPVEIQSLITLFQTLGKEGKISGLAMAEGIQAAKDKIDSLIPGIQTLAEAFKLFGLKSREEAALTAAKYKEAYDFMKLSGQATAAELRTAFTTYAEAAVAANKGVVSAQLQTEAAMRGLRIAVDETGKVIVKSMSDGRTAIDRATDGFVKSTTAVEGTSDAMAKLLMKYQLQAQYSEQQIGLLEKEAEARQRLIDLENKRLNIDAQGFSKDKAGQTVNAGGETWISIMNTLKGFGVTDDAAARKIASEFTDSKGNVPFFSNPGQKKYEADTLSMAIQKAATQYLLGAGAPKVGGDGARSVVEFKAPDGKSATMVTTQGTTVETIMAVLQSSGAVASAKIG